MPQFPDHDNEYTDYRIGEVRPADDGWEVGITSPEEGDFFFLPKPSPVEPTVGMECRVYGLLGHPVRGVYLNGQQVFYRTPAEENHRHAQWVEEKNKEKKEEFDKQREQYNTRIAALPEVFQRRIKKFQDTNPDFDWEFGGYELFVCEQAWVFVTTLGTKEALVEWSKLPYEEQKQKVPGLDDGHSGNTFGCAVRLAYHYLNERENVVREHGSLTPLVGCEKFGCYHPKPT